MTSILVVDDDQRMRALLTDFLETLNYVVYTASSGEEALALLKKETMDAMLLDIRMPGMDGKELLQKVRDVNEELSVIMVTGVIDVETAVWSLKMGAYDYVTKPFDLWRLEPKIQKAIERGRWLKKAKDYWEGLEEEVKEKAAGLRNYLHVFEKAHNRAEEGDLETIHRLSMAVEFRHHETASHLKRISELSAAIASALGLSERVVQLIKVASILHDIGKIGITDSILLKPDKLNVEEFSEVKKHTIMGAKILSGSHSDLLRMAEAIALTHHEKYDGTGYPEGLKGDNIPIEGRIVAVTDVFDALTNRRVYKPAYPCSVAYGVLREESGKHFDPEVVQAFFRGNRTIKEIRANNRCEEVAEGL